jgi:hypothetical protein
MEKVIEEIKLNKKGLENLAAFLRSANDIKSADLLESRDEKYIEYWNYKLTNHASIHDGKLIGSSIDLIDHRGIHAYSFDISEFDIVFGEELVEDFL